MGIKNIDFQNHNIARTQCSQFLLKNVNPKNFNKNEKYFGLIKQLKSKDCFYLKSDKGNSIVVWVRRTIENIEFKYTRFITYQNNVIV